MTLIHTPIETYRVRGCIVHVKRDDLCAAPPYPPLGKLRGLSDIVRQLIKDGRRIIGCWDTRVSKLGIGLAAALRDQPGARAIVCYPQLKDHEMPATVAAARELGAEIVPMRGNHISICWAQAQKLVESRGGAMLPFGLECPQAVEAVRAEAATIPAHCVRGGTVVMSCGSAVTLCGVVLALRLRPRRIVGLSAGRSVTKLKRCVHKYTGEILANIALLPAASEYNDVCDNPCPFPAHPHYDRKAWAYLESHIRGLNPPVLFWNIGA